MAVIRVEHLTKRFGSHVAVDDVTFDVTAGEVLGFLGPNGAGKTTTMRMLTGYLPPTRGRVSVDGFDLLDRPLEVKRRIGYLPENPPLYPELTVHRYLEFVAEIKDVPPRRRAAQIDRAIERTNLGEVRSTRISKLSKGFKQRVGLAQAIVHEPPVLILDEPTSSLDPRQRVEVRDLITQLRGQHTVILSTHILPEVSGLADRLFIINKGRIIASDTPARLAEKLRVREVVVVEIQAPEAGGAPVPTREDLTTALSSLTGVTQVTIDEMTPGTWTARIESEAGSDSRAHVAGLVAARGWRLLGLRAELLSLEEVFLKLIDSES